VHAPQPPPPRRQFGFAHGLKRLRGPIVLAVVLVIVFVLLRSTHLQQSNRTLRISPSAARVLGGAAERDNSESGRETDTATSACAFHGPWYERWIGTRGPNAVTEIFTDAYGSPVQILKYQCVGGHAYLRVNLP
jgi:hypothetical protein